MKNGPGKIVRRRSQVLTIGGLANGLMRTRRALFGVAQDGRGVVSIEFALLAIILAVLGVGMFDFGRFGMAHMKVHNAARAGTQFGTLNPSVAGDAAGMELAAYDDADVDPNNPGHFVPVANNYCLCPGTMTAQGCGTTCSDGGFAPRFVEVVVEDKVGLLFDYPGMPPQLDVRSTSRMRVQ